MIKMVFEANTQVPEFPIDLFNYCREDKTFTQESSTLEIPPGKVFNHIKILNSKTKGSRLFWHQRTLMDASGEDIGGWEYKTGDGIKLIIWND